jgi:hypothetical protein
MAVLPRGYVASPSPLPEFAISKPAFFAVPARIRAARGPRPFTAQRKLGTLRSLWPTLLSPT